MKRIPVRSDRYFVEPVNNGKGYIEIAVARGRKMRIRYAGKLRWLGSGGG